MPARTAEPADTRPRVTTSKPVDLAALDAALGNVGLCGDATEEGRTVIVAAEGAKVTQRQLEAAVAAHTPPPAAPARPPRDERIANARTKAQALPAGAQRDAALALLDAVT